MSNDNLHITADGVKFEIGMVIYRPYITRKGEPSLHKLDTSKPPIDTTSRWKLSKTSNYLKLSSISRRAADRVRDYCISKCFASKENAYKEHKKQLEAELEKVKHNLQIVENKLNE